ncbi:MAG: segregation/condensation protein A [Planctomycetes bacterium]|nr:segregation/condensation protein A [Planctomycetota bacterium]
MVAQSENSDAGAPSGAAPAAADNLDAGADPDAESAAEAALLGAEEDALDYTVALDVYTGPLDLLLFLIKENEVDIADIPIAAITDQYLAYMETLRELNVNVAGEFLLMAATLLEIKSKMVLPRPEEEGDGEGDAADPRLELVRHLLEYKKYKDLSEELRRRADARSRRATRGFNEIPTRTVADETLFWEDVSIWSLFQAFSAVAREIGLEKPALIVYDDRPVRAFMEEIYARLKAAGRLPFKSLFPGSPDRLTLIGAFLALLELVRRRHLLVEQDPDGQIHLSFNPDGGPLVLDMDGNPLDRAFQGGERDFALVADPTDADQAAVTVAPGAPPPEAETIAPDDDGADGGGR